MGISSYKVEGSKKVKLDSFPTDSKADKVDKKEILKKTEKNLKEMGLLQERLYAEGKEGLLIVLQAIDAAGKDSTIKHVMSGINPQGVDVVSFKSPNSEELSHDFLWRIVKALPARGKIGLFNRSHYEDVLVVQVHQLNKKYKMASRVVDMDSKEFFEKRYRHIRNFEEYLYDNSYRVVKIFLNVSKEEQKKRFLERIDNPEKNWKFESGDLKEREHWDEYHKVFEDMLNKTSAPEAPWYVIPADQKWYARYLVSEVIVQALRDIDPHFPEMPEEEKQMLKQCKESLLQE